MKIITSFELIFSGASVIFSLLLIIIYLIIFENLKTSNYFRFQFMIVILIDAALRFVKDYENENALKENSNKEDDNIPIILKLVCEFRSSFEISILFFLTSFTILSYLTVQKKTIYASRKRTFIITFSIISWIFPIIYNCIFFMIYMFKENGRDGFFQWKNIVVFTLESKLISDMVLIGILFLIDFIFFILMLVKLCQNSKKKKDLNETIVEQQNHCLRIFAVFSSQILFFVVYYFTTIGLFCFEECEKRWPGGYNSYSNLIYVISLSMVSFFYAFDSHVSNFLGEKIMKCIDFKHLKKKDSDYIGGKDEDDDGYEDVEEDDDEEEEEIYVENEDGVVSNISSGRNTSHEQ